MKWPLLLLALLPLGCAETTFVDSGTTLAATLERGAKTLRTSQASEIAVTYAPMHGGDQDYVIDIYHTSEGPPMPGVRASALCVRCATGGTTSSHERFVYVPHDLHASKSHQPATIVLRKSGKRIDVVAIR